MLEEINKAVNFIKSKIPDCYAETGIVLGSGLGELSEEFKLSSEIPCTEIPGFLDSGETHEPGMLIYGAIGNKKILIMQGRLHYYEGYSMKEITFPIRVMKALGIRYLILTGAVGSINPSFEIGDIMIIKDHINNFPENPLRGENEEELGPRFPDMSEVYDKNMRLMARGIASRNIIEIKEGVYVGCPGPNYETPAEYKMFLVLGGDVMGMSTIPEAIVARHMNVKVFGLYVITDMGIPNAPRQITNDVEKRIASFVKPKMAIIIRELITALPEGEE